MEEDEPDRSALEIKALLHKLSPTLSHKDRVRSLQRFRNYTSGDRSKKSPTDSSFSTPIFYDDDIPLLFLGSSSPASKSHNADPDSSSSGGQNSVGLLSACAQPSTEHKGGLKRSCRNAMSLMKYLALEYVEIQEGEPVSVSIDAASGLPELNPFAYAICSLSVSQLRLAKWEAHLLTRENDKRGGAKDDACEVLLLILQRHFDPVSDNATVLSNMVRPERVKINIEELLPDVNARKAFENWLVLHKHRDVVSWVRDNFLNPKPKVAASSRPKPATNPFGEEEGEEVDLDTFETRKQRMKSMKINLTQEEKDAMAEAEAHAEQQLGKLGLELYDKPADTDTVTEAEGSKTGGGGGGGKVGSGGRMSKKGPATTWADSYLSKQDAMFDRDGGVEGGKPDGRKIVENANEERAKRLHLEHEKMTMRDPLGIRPDTFDLKNIQGRVVELLQQAIADLDDEITETSNIGKKDGNGKKKRKNKNAGYNLDQLVSLEAQRDSLQAILEGRQLGVAKYGPQPHDENTEHDDAATSAGEEGEPSNNRKYLPPPRGVEDLSILPTDPYFNPLLLLTLVHRNASYQQLKDGLSRLNNKTENQASKLQSLVRDNFALFIRCADGIDLFSEKADSPSHSSSTSPSSTGKENGVNTRLDTIDAIAASCTEQAKRSFKPLLDNTIEVRKVQAAIAVLNRVGPLLQVPSLMRQHIENGRFSAAVKEYRRVLVIDDYNKIELLRHVKRKAAEAARDARRDLEYRLANPTVPVQSMLDSLRDLEELIELDIPAADGEDGGGGGKDGEGEGEEELSRVGVTSPSVGKFTVGEVTVDVRKYPPCLSCLLLQAAHFSLLVQEAVSEVDDSCYRTFAGETLPAVREDQPQLDPYGVPLDPDDAAAAAKKPNSSTASTSSSTAPIQNTTHKTNPSPSSSSSSTSSTTSTTSSTAALTTTTLSTTDSKRERNRWKYQILEHRVVATIRTVKIARTWLPRLLRIAEAARQAERRRAARVGRRGGGRGGGGGAVPMYDNGEDATDLTAFEVFVTNICPSVRTLVEHAAFCSLGCHNDAVDSEEGDKEDLKITFGFDTDPPLQRMLRSPLPDLQSTRCATELADLSDVVQDVASAAVELRPNEHDIDAGIGGNYGGKSSHYFIALESVLEEIDALTEDAVVTIERRKCIYAFDSCAKTCSIRANGGGTFGGDAILECVQNLGDDLTRPESCAREIENGCVLVVTKCCDGLDNYVNDRGRDRGDSARLRTVAECAEALEGCIVDVVTETEDLTNGACEILEDALIKRVMDLEGAMFDEFLESVRVKIQSYTRLGPMLNNHDHDRDEEEEEDDQYVVVDDEQTDTEPPSPKNTSPPSTEPKFPAYLSASLLAIVRCRAQVERTLGEKTIRKSEGVPYQFLAMSTAANSVVDGICYEMREAFSAMRGKQAEVYLNELQFLINTLRKYLSRDVLELAEGCREDLLARAGTGVQGDGPDGLMAIEELERLGRVHVLCLGV